jgi:hypothetical protein
MPKLNKATAKTVAGQEPSDSLQPLPNGTYVATLTDVTSEVGRASGKPYWKWVFEIIEEDQVDGCYRKAFLNTSLQDSAAFKLAEAFAAFDATPDTDTDDLLGDDVQLVIAQVVQASGAKKGQLGNEIVRLLPLNAEDSDGDGDAIEPF